MTKLNPNSKQGDQVEFFWEGARRAGVIKEVNEEFFVLEIADEYIQLPYVGKEMGFSHFIVNEMYENEKDKDGSRRGLEEG